MPRSAATCAIGRPLSSASRTPRSSNSSGYFLGLDMTAEDLLSPGQHPDCEVLAKPGPADGASRPVSCDPRVRTGAVSDADDRGTLNLRSAATPGADTKRQRRIQGSAAK